MTYLADRTNYVMHQIGRHWKKGEDVEYVIALSPPSNPNAPYGDEAKRILRQFEEAGAIKIKEPGGRDETGKILDIGFEPAREIKADIWYLEVIGEMVEDIDNKQSKT